jgi:hypothetical protein
MENHFVMTIVGVLKNMRIRLRHFVYPANFKIQIASGHQVIAHQGHGGILPAFYFAGGHFVSGFGHQISLISRFSHFLSSSLLPIWKGCGLHLTPQLLQGEDMKNGIQGQEEKPVSNFSLTTTMKADTKKSDFRLSGGEG